MQPKKSEIVRNWEAVFPNDANPQGTMFGGKLMAKMDMTAGIAASRYSGMQVVTASSESIVFKQPIHLGDRIETIARVVWVGKSSMVVKVDVFAEDPVSGSREHCTAAHFTFVALDEKGRPAAVQPLLVETEEDKRDYEIAEIVKKQALERKQKTGKSG